MNYRYKIKLFGIETGKNKFIKILYLHIYIHRVNFCYNFFIFPILGKPDWLISHFIFVLNLKFRISD